MSWLARVWDRLHRALWLPGDPTPGESPLPTTWTTEAQSYGIGRPPAEEPRPVEVSPRTVGDAVYAFLRDEAGREGGPTDLRELNLVVVPDADLGRVLAAKGGRVVVVIAAAGGHPSHPLHDVYTAAREARRRGEAELREANGVRLPPLPGGDGREFR